jgi:hypothetical protein
LDAANRGTTDNQWDDLSGNGNHFTAAAANEFPVFSGGEATFDGIDDHLDGPSLSALTEGECFVLIKRANDNSETGTNTGSFHDVGASGSVNHYLYDNTIYDNFGRSGRLTVGDPTPPVDVYRIINIHSATNDWAFKFDGSVLYSEGTNTPSFRATPVIGAGAPTGGYFFDGSIKVYLLYNRKLTTEERATVNEYLATLYPPTLLYSTTDLTGWGVVGTPTVSHDQLGVEGEPNTATYIEDNATSSVEYISYYHDLTAGTDKLYRAKYFIKKDADETRFIECHLRHRATSGFTVTGDGIALSINTATGASTVRVDVGTNTATVESYDDNWWEVTLTVRNDGSRYVALAVMPAAGASLGDFANPPVGSVICGGARLYEVV